MIYIRILFVIFVVLLLFYYGLVIGQLIGVCKFTREPIKFKKLLIPFYYFTKYKQFKTI